jgi:hypothetical protein
VTIEQLQALYDEAVRQTKDALVEFERVKAASADIEVDEAVAAAGDQWQFASGVEHVALHVLKFAKRHAADG